MTRFNGFDDSNSFDETIYPHTFTFPTYRFDGYNDSETFDDSNPPNCNPTKTEPF